MTLAALLLAVALQDAAPFKHENTPDNLKQLFEKLQKAVAAGDDKTALALTKGLLPDEAALKKGLKDGLAPDVLGQCVEFWAKLVPGDDAKRARLFAADPANTDVRVYAASTEDLLGAGGEQAFAVPFHRYRFVAASQPIWLQFETGSGSVVVKFLA